LYPKTRLIVRRVKEEGSLIDYTNEVHVEIDYSDVDPDLIKADEDDAKIEKLEALPS